MCPFCFASAVLIAGGVASTGGLAAIAIRKFGVKPSPEEKNGAGDRSELTTEEK
jgi:hypothetical protein